MISFTSINAPSGGIGTFIAAIDSVTLSASALEVGILPIATGPFPRTDFRYPIPASGVLKDFFANMVLNSASGAGSADISVLINGSIVGTVSFVASELGIKSIPGDIISVSAGDLLSFHLVKTGSISGSISTRMSVRLA